MATITPTDNKSYLKLDSTWANLPTGWS